MLSSISQNNLLNAIFIVSCITVFVLAGIFYYRKFTKRYISEKDYNIVLDKLGIFENLSAQDPKLVDVYSQNPSPNTPRFY